MKIPLAIAANVSRYFTASTSAVGFPSWIAWYTERMASA
jgi:hypothetical protein